MLRIILICIFFLLQGSINAKNINNNLKDPIKSKKETKNIINKNGKSAKQVSLNNKTEINKEKAEKNSETALILDLKAALGLALVKNETVKIAKLKVGIADNKVNAEYSAFMPSISATTGYTHSIGYNYINDNTFELTRKLKRNLHSNDFSAGLSGKINIFNFGRDYYSLLISKSNKQISEYDLSINEKKIILNVLSYYYYLLSSIEKEKAMIEMQNLYKNTMDAAKLKYKLGIVPLVDKLSAENSYSESSLKNEESKSNTKKTQIELSVLMGLEANAEFDIEKNNQKPKKLTFEIEDLKKTALLNRADFKKLKETKKALEYELKTLKASRYPSVDLNGSVGTRKNLDSKDTDFLNNSSITVGISVPIFSGFSVTNSIKSKEKEIKAYEFEINAAKKNIEKEVLSSYYDFVINQEKFFITKELLKTATENAKVMLGMYKNGKISILELLNAQAKLEEVKINFVESKYNWFIYRAKLLNAIGRLSLSNIINIYEF